MRKYLAVLMLLIVPFSGTARAQSSYTAGLYQFEDEALNYSGVWNVDEQGSITREFTDAGSVEFNVTGQTLVIQRRMCPTCGAMTIDVAGQLLSYDNTAPDTADYPLLIALDNSTLTITITAVGDLWLNYFMVLDPAIDALPVTPDPDALVVWAIRPEYQYHNQSGHIVAIAHSVTAGELAGAALFFASLLLLVFGLMAGESQL